MIGPDGLISDVEGAGFEIQRPGMHPAAQKQAFAGDKALRAINLPRRQASAKLHGRSRRARAYGRDWSGSVAVGSVVVEGGGCTLGNAALAFGLHVLKGLSLHLVFG